MNALADAAFLSRPTEGLMPPIPASSTGSYSEQELHAMGVISPASVGMGGMLPPHARTLMGPPSGLPPAHLGAMGNSLLGAGSSVRSLVTGGALQNPGRHLQILDHTVHRIDAHTKANGEEEKEMVVSNLRHFALKIGVVDPRYGLGRDAELPLKAELLYENGQPVEQLATCEPLLVGKTEVVAMQGTALFKLRITSLSSHRDKQRFRIRVSPADSTMLLTEPGLSVVTTPMKCVTKLSHRSSANGSKLGVEGEEGADDWDEEAAAAANGSAANGIGNGVKRKRAEDIEPLLEAQAQQLHHLQKTNETILEQLQALRDLLSTRLPPSSRAATMAATE